MPKMKSNRGAAKRFKVSKNGKVMRSKANKSHILTKKKRKRKRHLRQETQVSTSNTKRIRILIQK
jgi:large subunit ribosomal protein L35